MAGKYPFFVQELSLEAAHVAGDSFLKENIRKYMDQ